MTVSPPRSKGPHLNALRAFEAAARLGSYTGAADELCVTPSAISQHIKTLEGWAESPLFVRNAQGVALTNLGEELLPSFTAAFDQLSDAVQSLRTKAQPQKIKLATLPAIAQLWLSARLGGLRKRAPEISVSVVAVEVPPNLLREPYDVTLFFKEGPLDVDEVEIFQDCIFPVCTPEIADRLTSIESLENETLLHDSTWSQDWQLWLSSSPGAQNVPMRGPVFSLFSVALEEARHGAGILIAHKELVERFLKTAELVAPFDTQLVITRKLVMKPAPSFIGTDRCRILTEALIQ